MTWVTFLIGMVGPMVLRVLATLGMSVVTFTGVTAIVGTLVSQAQSSWAGLPAAVLGLGSLAGLPQALGIVCGAFTARATLWAVTSATKLVFKT